jgi:hypothetical protein
MLADGRERKSKERWRKFQHHPHPDPLPSREREMKRKAPRWTVAFLRSLERTGEVEAAARDAGIDKSTAYLRRKLHADFALAWEEALKRRQGAAEEAVQEKVGFWERVFRAQRVRGTGEQGGEAKPSPLPSPASGRGGPREELLASTALGGKLVRAGPGRWNREAEQRFFDELAASANVRRACAAAGVSANAVYARRMKRPDFRAKWDAVLETGRAAIEMHLVETAKKSFDADELDTGDVQPRVSVAEAIRIVQIHGSKAQQQRIEEIEPPEDEIEAVRERLFNKLQRLRERCMKEDVEKGWSYDEEHNMTIPPGWVRAATEDGPAHQ